MAAKSDRDFYSFEEAAELLVGKGYSKEKALKFVAKYDKNHDNILSRKEYDNYITMLEQFNKFDKDKDNNISLSEAVEILKGDPFYLSKDKVKQLLRTFDVDGNGILDFDEFLAFYTDAKSKSDGMLQRFRKLDKDKNNLLVEEEVIGAIMEELHIDRNKAQEMINQFDKNADGKLDKNEFMDMWFDKFGKDKK